MNGKIQSALEALSCCRNCILRFSGIKDKAEHLQAALLTSPRACPACLGILGDQEIVAKRIKNELESQKFSGIDTYLTSVTLPFAPLSIRQRSISHFLKSALENELIPDPIDVREIVKILLTSSITAATQMQPSSTSPFAIELTYIHPDTQSEYKWVTQCPPADFRVKESRKRGKDQAQYATTLVGLTNAKLCTALDKLVYQDFLDSTQCPPPAIETKACVEKIEFTHAAIYVAGRYQKRVRNISNSPWMIGGVLKVPESVEGFVSGHLTRLFRAHSHKFSSAGREDADVLMLGDGRPFYFELIKPKYIDVPQESMTTLEQEINEAALGKVVITDLQVSSRDGVTILKQSASTKCKTYSCLIRLSSAVSMEKLKEISEMGEIELKQQNPTRVPRRADLVRDKLIHSLSLIRVQDDDTIEGVDEGCVICATMRTSAGTYVKEFVHSDNGRTVPSLKSLLAVESASVISLDVLSVELDWPPRLSSSIPIQLHY